MKTNSICALDIRFCVSFITIYCVSDVYIHVCMFSMFTVHDDTGGSEHYSTLKLCLSRWHD